ncbi:cobalamin biosynthesis protein [Streptomyces sp. NPDC059922]|uniref:cobalamin biosynthesis protein n=1 Tax=Streptomyces sp. NPDC059922 TaxID=3347005 RepID=UPI003662447D
MHSGSDRHFAHPARGPGRAPEPGYEPEPGLVVGVGARSGVSVAEVLGLIETTLRDAGLSPCDLIELATAESRTGEAGIAGAAARLGVPLRGYPATLLAGIAVPNPSGAPLAALGTPSVAEAAALAGGGELLVPKRKSDAGAGRRASVTCAVADRSQSEWNRRGRK